MKTRRIMVTMFAGGGLAHTSGGVGTFIRYLEDEWATQPGGPKVRVIDTRGKGGKASMAWHFLVAVSSLLSLGLIGRIDLLHIHMSAYGSALRKGILTVLGSMLGIPVILHMHGSNFGEFFAKLPGFGRRALRFALNKAHHIIVLGNGWRDFLISEAGVAPHKIVIIFNGVPGPIHHTERLPCRSGDAVRIVFLGQLGERKGVPELLAAFQSEKLASRAWTASVAGDGAVDEARAVVAKAGLQGRVAIPGWLSREATTDLLRKADIFVLPSHFEAMPIAILEAMAHGVAVIATPVGAIPEFLTDGQNALLVPPGAREKLADALARLIDDAVERGRLGIAGHQVFCDRFHIGVAARRILALYHSAMSTGRKKNWHKLQQSRDLLLFLLMALLSRL
jgi:glycosyltransferase involved in cell wall biosynthesis